MDESTVIEEFNRPTPRKVCLKQDSAEAGVGFNPWDFSSELGCGGFILGVLLLLALIPAFRQEALIAAVLFVGAVSILALLLSSSSFSDVRHHRLLACHGVAVVGEVTRLTSVQVNDGTPAPPTETTLKYRFRTREGQEISETRKTISGWYKALAQDGQVVVIYLSNEPDKNEPYNSLRYRICK